MVDDHSIPSFPADVDREAFGHWLSGFTDGEGCFFLAVCTNKTCCGNRTPSPRARFLITVRLDDRPVLELIQSYFGVGFVKIRRKKSGKSKLAVSYYVSNAPDQLRVIVPHFERYPLRAKKARDFAFWKQGVETLYRMKNRGFQGRRGCTKWTADEVRDFTAIVRAQREQRKFKITPGGGADEVPVEQRSPSLPLFDRKPE